MALSPARRLALAGFAFLALNAMSTPAPPSSSHPSYHDLQRFEGVYESEDGWSLGIAASPKEEILYAIIADTRYPMRPIGADTFLDGMKHRIQFTIVNKTMGYTDLDAPAKRWFKRLRPAHFPKATWYPRLPEAGPALPVPPPDLKDGLAVGPVAGSGLDPAKIAAMVRALAEDKYPGIHSVLVIQDGKLVVEEYFYEYGRDTLHPLRSATKSFVSALVGKAIEEGKIAGVKAPVLPFFEGQYAAIANPSDDKRKITVEDLLTQSSGLDCDDWNPSSAGHENKMGETDDWVKFILDLPSLHPPGEVARYCSGGSVTLGRIVERATGEPLARYAKSRLFEPLGIDRFEWHFQPDRSSRETFTQLNLRPRDMAKFGLLYLTGGRWNGKQVLPETWVEASKALHSHVGDMDYGYLWWRLYLNAGGRRHDGFMATGNGGQKIYLWPALNRIVVMTGGNYNRDSPSNEILAKYLLPRGDG